jgi:hypothetical protein
LEFFDWTVDDSFYADHDSGAGRFSITAGKPLPQKARNNREIGLEYSAGQGGKQKNSRGGN